jgi:hypothetical protein
MTNPTTPFNWQMPTASDLVTDLPADFETFGQAVATSMADLLGGTTGQILSKASNTDMDFTWITNDVGDITAVTAGTGLTGGGTSGAVSLAIDSTVTTLTGTQTLTNKTLTSPVLTTPTISTVDAKGDLLAGTGDNTIARLAVGTNNQVLTADSSTATGLKWATPAGGGGKVLQVVSATKTDTFTSTSGTYTDITGLSVSITPSATSSKIMVFINLTGNGSPAVNGSFYQLVRGSTAIAIGDTAAGKTSTSGTMYINDAGQQTSTSFSHLDSPSTTSATTYKVQGLIPSGTFYINRSSGDGGSTARSVSTITVMEIGA